MSCDCHANHCIQCSVTQCRNHCSDENYCSLERIQVGTHRVRSHDEAVHGLHVLRSQVILLQARCPANRTAGLFFCVAA